MPRKTAKTADKSEPAPLPALDALPFDATEHGTLHRIVNARVSGDSKKALAAKFTLPPAYVNGVLHHYLERFDS